MEYAPHLLFDPFRKSNVSTPKPISPCTVMILSVTMLKCLLILSTGIISFLLALFTLLCSFTGYITRLNITGCILSFILKLYFSTFKGSCVLLSRISKCRWGPPDLPVFPESPIYWPFLSGNSSGFRCRSIS